MIRSACDRTSGGQISEYVERGEVPGLITLLIGPGGALLDTIGMNTRAILRLRQIYLTNKHGHRDRQKAANVVSLPSAVGRCTALRPRHTDRGSA